MKTIIITCIQLLGFFSLLSCLNVSKLDNHAISELERALTNGQNFVAEDMTFEGPLDLDSLLSSHRPFSPQIGGELRFINCNFEGPITWKGDQGRRLYVERDIIFENCTFEQIVINDAVFNGRFQMGNCFIRKTLDLQRNTFRSTCRLDENQIGHDLKLQYSRFWDDLSVFSNDIGNHLLMQGCSVLGMVQLSNTRLNGSLDLSNGNYRSGAMMDYLEGGDKILAGNCRFDRRLSLRQINGFTTIKLSNSVILGDYTFSTKLGKLSPEISNTLFLSSEAMN